MSNNNAKTGRNRLKSPKTLGVIVVVASIALIAVWLTVVRGGEDPMSNFATFTVKRGPLTISVLESGTIQPREQITLRNEVEGRTSVVSLVPDGAMVKAGDLLVELDASTLTDAIIDQEIKVQNAHAAYIDANETLAVVNNQAISDVNLAELTLRFAIQDMNQYLVGQYPNELTKATNEITLADEELKRATETLSWSKKLYEQQYISQNELMADQLAVTRSTNTLSVRENDKKLLEEFTYKRNVSQFRSDVYQAQMALERAHRKASADIVQAEASLKAKELEYKRQQDKLKKMKDQFAKTKIYAPQDGMVVYATTSGRRGPFDRREPLDIGVEVTERQDLIRLPTATLMKAAVDIHESSLQKVRVGLPAVITVDALPGKKFLGRIDSIARLPDARSMWMNPDLKIYPTEIYLEDNDSELRTGMSCAAEIIVAQYEDAVYVPVWAVLRVAGQPTVYVVKDGSYAERKVEVGLDDNRMIRIISGLDEGEVVLLTPPLEPSAVEPGYATTGAASPDATDTSDVMKQRINESLEKANGAQVGMPSPGFGDFTGRETQTPRSEARGGAEEGGPQQGQGEGGGFPDMSSEQMQKMRQRFENMSPEERQKEIEKMKQRFENMSPEEREKMRQRFQGTGRRQGRGSRQGESSRPQGGERDQ